MGGLSGVQRSPPAALSPAAHRKRANYSSGSADFSRAAAHALSPPEEPMWALKMCSLSLHDEPCILPLRSAWRAPHLLTSNPRRTLPSTTEKPLAASPQLLTFNPRRSLPSPTAMPLAVPLHLLTFNPRRSLPSPNDEAIQPLNSCSLSRPSTCSTFAQVRSTRPP